jgi:hypothetical protein
MDVMLTQRNNSTQELQLGALTVLFVDGVPVVARLRDEVYGSQYFYRESMGVWLVSGGTERHIKRVTGTELVKFVDGDTLQRYVLDMAMRCA